MYDEGVMNYFQETDSTCILLSLIVETYPILVDTGVFFDGPILLQCKDGGVCSEILRSIPDYFMPEVGSLGDSPKKMERFLQEAEYGIVALFFSETRYTGENLEKLVEVCKQHRLMGEPLLVIILAGEMVPEKYKRQMALSLSIDGDINIKPVEAEVSRLVIEKAEGYADIIQNRIIHEMTDESKDAVSVFSAARIALDVILSSCDCSKEQKQAVLIRLDKEIARCREEAESTGDSLKTAMSFCNGLYEYLQEADQPALLKCDQIASKDIGRVNQTVCFDADYYFVPYGIFCTICKELNVGHELSIIKRQLEEEGLLVTEGDSRKYYTGKTEFVNVYGACERKRRVKLCRTVLDEMTCVSLAETFGEKEILQDENKNEKNYDFLLLNQASNLSILFSGLSGMGKTHGMNRLEEAIADAGGTVIAFNFGGTHLPMMGNPRVVIIRAYDEDIPVPLFNPITRPDGTVEDMNEVVDSLLDVFSGVYRMGSNQMAVLREALQEEMKGQLGGKKASFLGVADYLKSREDNAAKSVFNKFRQLLSKAKLNGTGLDWLEPGKIYIFDFEGFNSSAQCLLTELCVSSLWRYYKVWGQRKNGMLYLALDEFQSLNLGKDSVLSQVLREGRKYHMALLLATQTLESFSPGQRAIILQAATCLYFRPAPSEVRKVARYTGADELKSMEKELRNLKRGECIAAGQFDGIDSPIKLHF